jgi:glycosyltransferase involved in cell wall biosynthesis
VSYCYSGCCNVNPRHGIRSVTFVVVSEILGGGELFTLRLAEGLMSRCDVGIVGVSGTPVMEEAARRGMRWEQLRLGRKLGRQTALHNAAMVLTARRRLRSFVDSRGPRDWVVFQYSWEKLLWDGRSRGTRIAVIEHGPPPAPLLRFGLTRRSLRTTFLACDALFAASEPAAIAVKRLSGRSPRPIRAGVDPALTAAAKQNAADVRADLNIADEVPLLIYAGRLAENKGIFDLLAAARRNPELHLLFLGDGPADKVLRAKAESLGPRVALLGRVDDILPFLAAADATSLLTSDPGEGRPQLAVESVAVGTPVLGSVASAAMAALVAEGLDGVHLIDTTNAAAVDEGIAHVLAMEPPCAKAASWADVANDFISELRRHGDGPSI